MDNTRVRVAVLSYLMEREPMRLSTDALLTRICLATFLLVGSADFLRAATYTTPNFIVTAPTPEIAEKCGKTAEYYRDALAEEWLGKKMPRWYKPCTLSVKVGQIGAGGATTFAFDRGEVFGWRMNVQGSLERILDSVIPHEVSHTIFASHFRRPLPRWADEGAATLIEHESERRRQSMLLKQVWHSPQRIPLQKLLSIKEYPSDMQSVLTLYAEGYSLADFLVQAGGKTRYLEFLETAHRHGWDRAIEQHYSLEGVGELESRWNNWVLAGSPQIKIPQGTQIASNETPANNPTPVAAKPREFQRPVIRGQSPETIAPLTDQPETQVAGVSPVHVTEANTPVPLPQTKITREESPGWRRMREQMEAIPDDFINPAQDPRQLANTNIQTQSVEEQLQFTNRSETTSPPRIASDPPSTTTVLAPGVPPFRFELD